MEPPDREERIIRFGCGAVFGLVVAGLAALKLSGLSWPWWAAIAAVAVGGCGYAAVRHGDEFWWDALRSRWWW